MTPPVVYDNTLGTVGQSALSQASAPVLGGGGGGGGSGGPLAIEGETGPNGEPINGEDGMDGIAEGGDGGIAGGNGEASGRAHADGVGQLNPDGQLILEWSFLHNQDATIDVSGAGGAGGGGAGGANMNQQQREQGGNGGAGGNGDMGETSLLSRQGSDANIEAVLGWGNTVPPGTPFVTTGGVVVNIGWVSAGDLENIGGNVWARGVAIDITFGPSAWLAIETMDDTIVAWGQNSQGEWFSKASGMPLSSDTGTFDMAPGEFWNEIAVGDTGTITTGQPPLGAGNVFSQLNGRMRAAGGDGGEAGWDDGADGEDGEDAGEDGGAGGAGGSGGAGANGGNAGGAGGDGGQGDSQNGAKNGMFQGLISLWVDNIPAW
ncbi:MAG: hypothetical protein ACYTG0_15755 [Planctomycetota bacterium]